MPTWTKKDYEAVAEVLYTTEMTEDERNYLASNFGHAFQADNFRFDAMRFMAAVRHGELWHRSGKQPRWTSRTFKEIARILKAARATRQISEETHARLVRQFAEKSAQTNPRFDAERFERAAFRHPQDSVPVRRHVRRSR